MEEKKEYRYVLQRRYQTKIAKKVGDALGDIFEHIEKGSLHILEDMFVLTCQEPLPKSKKDQLCSMLLDKAKETEDTETLSFEVVPYNESIVGKAEGANIERG